MLSIYRRMTDEYKTEKGEDVWNRGSRPNEIISWHLPGVIKEKHEKLSSYTVSKHTSEPRTIRIRIRSANHWTANFDTVHIKNVIFSDNGPCPSYSLIWLDFCCFIEKRQNVFVDVKHKDKCTYTNSLIRGSPNVLEQRATSSYCGLVHWQHTEKYLKVVYMAV